MSTADTCPDATMGATDVFDAISLNQTTASAVYVIPDEYSRPLRLAMIAGASTYVCVYLARWSAPLVCNGLTIQHGTGHEFGWDDKQWVSLGSFRRGGRRPGQWGERARKRRAKRRKRAGFTRAYKRFDRYPETRQGQNWFDLENARDPSEGP